MEERMKIEEEEQEEFISHAKNQIIEDHLKELKGAKNISHVL